MNLNNMRRYGVEVEFYSRLNMNSLGEKIYRETGIEVHRVNYSNRDTDLWRLKPDASLSSVTRNGENYYPMELVTPILHGEEDLQKLKRIVQIIDLDGYVNKQTGLHVHVDIADATVEELRRFMAYAGKYEDAINTILPPSRRQSRWAKNHLPFGVNLKDYYTDINRQSESKRDLVENNYFNGRGTRYLKWNFENYWRTGTVENRAHSGTTDCDKIENWVRLIQGIIHRTFKAKCTMWTKKNATAQTYDIKHMVWDLYKNDAISADVRKFYFKRYKVLNNDVRR